MIPKPPGAKDDKRQPPFEPMTAEFKHQADATARPTPEAPVDAEVWTVAVNQPPEIWAAAVALLSPEEQTRLESFRHESARQRYLIAHAALRQVLSAHLQIEPAEIRFCHGPHGKPELAGEVAGRLHFNLSHSGDLVLVAVSPHGSIGVDVEMKRPLPNAPALARRFFTRAELAELEAPPAAGASTAFQKLWTAKEAVAKALGRGIMPWLKRIEISLAPEPKLRALDGDPVAARNWALHSFSPSTGYFAAVAMPAANVELHQHEFRWR